MPKPLINALDTLVRWEKNVLRRWPETAELKQGSRKRFGIEFHVNGAATANA